MSGWPDVIALGETMLSIVAVDAMTPVVSSNASSPSPRFLIVQPKIPR